LADGYWILSSHWLKILPFDWLDAFNPILSTKSTLKQQQSYTFTPEQQQQQSYTFTPEQQQQQQPYTFTPEQQQQQQPYTFTSEQQQQQLAFEKLRENCGL